MLQFLIATLLTLLASLMKLKARLTEEPIKSLKLNPSLSNLEMPAWSEWFLRNPCVLKLSTSTHLLEDLPSET